MPEFKRHLVSILVFCFLLSLANSEKATSTHANPAERNLDSILGDRNTWRLVLPLENTVVVDGTTGHKISGLFKNSHLNLQNVTQNSTSYIAQNDTKLLALIVVMSQPLPQERLRRDAIRSSWARWAPDLNMKVVFFLGIKSSNLTSEVASSLIDEINTFGDIVIDNIEENYYRLAAKVLRAFKWFLQRYSNETLRPIFFVKTDTDVFIKLRHLADVLHKIPDAHNFIGGNVWRSAGVFRDPADKYYMPFRFWPGNKYPDFTLGWFYIFSSALIQPVLEGSLGEKLIQLEDVYITGIISKNKLGLNLTHLPGIVKHFGKLTDGGPDRKNNFAFHLPDADLSSFSKLYNELNADGAAG